MSSINTFKDVGDRPLIKFENCCLVKQLDNTKTLINSKNHDSPIVRMENKEGQEVKPAIQNKLDGLQREKDVAQDLKKKYPSSEGYSIIPEAYLRGKDGKIVKDSVTGEARRIDFVVLKNGEVIDSIEVTSKTADKTLQVAKEERIRDNGGNYIRDNDGNLVKIPNSVQTRIERRD